MDPYSEKHPLSDDERCQSPRMAEIKKIRRLSSELIELEVGGGTLSSHFLQGARPKEYGAMHTEELEPTETFSSRLRHGARLKEYGAMRPNPLEPKGGNEMESSYTRYLEQKAYPTNESIEQDEQRLQRDVQSERQRESCNFLTPSMNNPRRQDYGPHKKASSNNSGNSGLWKVEVARCLTREHCILIALYKRFYAEVSHKIDAANLGLEVLEIMERKDLIGPDGQDLYSTLLNLNFSDAAETLQRSVPTKLTPPVHEEYTFEDLVKDLQENILRRDAHEIAHAFNFTPDEIDQVKTKGTCDLLAKLFAKNKLGPNNLYVLAEMLKGLEFDKAYKYIEKYESKFPVVPVRIAHDTTNSTEMDHDPEQQQKDGYINNLFSKLTATDNKDELSPIFEQLNKFLLSKNLKIVNLSKGSLILHLRVTSVATLNELVSSINSGEFAKDCSRILFPGKELEALGFGKEIQLTASYDIEIIERAKEELEKLEDAFVEVLLDEKGKASVNCPHVDIQSIPGDDEHCKPVVPVRLAHDTANSTEMEQDPKHQQKDGYVNNLFSKLTTTDNKEELPPIVEQLNKYLLPKGLAIVSLSKGSLILHLRVTSVASLNELVNSINSGEFAKDCSRILFPDKELEALGFGKEIQLTASYDIDIIASAKAELEKLENSLIEVHLDEEGDVSDHYPLPDSKSISGDDDEDCKSDCITVASEEDISVPTPIHRPVNYSSNAVLMLQQLGMWPISMVTSTCESLFTIFHEVNRLTEREESIHSCPCGNPVCPYDVQMDFWILNFVIYTHYNKVLMDDWFETSIHLTPGSPFGTPSLPLLTIHPEAMNDFIRYKKEMAKLIYKMFKNDLIELKWSAVLSELMNGPRHLQVSSVSKEEEVGKDQVGNQKRRLFDEPSGCTLKNVFWFPCTEKLVRRTLSLKEGNKDTMLTRLKNNFSDHGVHMVPHFLVIRRSIKLRQKGVARKTLDFPVCDQQIEDNHYLSENQKLEILRKRIADRTVYEAAVAISKWADDLELDVFIFTNYQYSDYLKNVSIATDIDGKHDILVICRNVGIIFIQVSSSMGKSRKVAKQQLQKKTQQLMKDKLVFLESNRDLSEVTSKIPVYQLAAFPNFTRELVGLDACSGHSQRVLTKECFDNDNIFVTLNEKISIPSEPCFSTKDYQYLCSRYVGIASTDKTRTSLDGIKTTFKILRKAFLTSEQRQILAMDDINSCMILTGDYGTGKSLLLTQKAIRFAKKDNCKPFLVSCADLQRFGGLQTTFENDTRGYLNIQREILDKLDSNIATFSIKYVEDQNASHQSFIEMFVSMLRGLTKGMEKVHILLDELPFIIIKENPSILNSLSESIPDESHLWLSITTISSTETELLENLVSKQSCNPQRFKLFHLDKIMRMPQTVVNLYSSIQEFTSGQCSNKAIGHVVMGPKPMLFRLDVCSCTKLDKASLTCRCTKLRLIKALRNIMKVAGDVKHDRISFYIHSITRLQEVFELLSDAMESFNFSLKWWFEKESSDTKSFSVLTENAHWRCESAVVISVDPLGMNHWEGGVGDRAIHTSVFSRCLSQYIHLVWPKQEAAELFDQELNSLEEDLRLYYVNARIIKENCHDRHTKSDEVCLEYLKKCNVFIDGPQYE